MKAALKFNLQPNKIFPLMNYYNESRKNFEIDRLIFKILSTATGIADSHARKHDKTLKSVKDQKVYDLIFDL